MLMKKQQKVMSNCHCTTSGVGSNDNNDPPISFVYITVNVGCKDI